MQAGDFILARGKLGVCVRVAPEEYRVYYKALTETGDDWIFRNTDGTCLRMEPFKSPTSKLSLRHCWIGEAFLATNYIEMTQRRISTIQHRLAELEERREEILSGIAQE